MNPLLTERGRRNLAFTVLFALLLPLALPAAAYAQIFARRPQQPAAPRQGMSTKKKLLALGGAALLYYLYRKHQAKRAAQAGAAATGTTGAATARGGGPQLYRSRNGGIYYRDAQGKPVWLTVPSQPLQIPAEDVQRYAPDYNRYRGPAPAAPQGYRAQPFSAFDSSLMRPAAAAPSSGAAPGPRGPVR